MTTQMEYGGFTEAEKEAISLGGETTKCDHWYHAIFDNQLQVSLFISWIHNNASEYHYIPGSFIVSWR